MAEGTNPTEQASVILGRALLVWPTASVRGLLLQQPQVGEDAWGSSFVRAVPRAEAEKLYDATEVLLVSPAAGRVLEAAQAVAACQSRGHPKWGAVLTELAAAVDVMVAQSPSSLPPVAQPTPEPAVEHKTTAKWDGRSGSYGWKCSCGDKTRPVFPALDIAESMARSHEQAARKPVPVPDSDGKGWDRDLVDAFSESSGEVATLERELAEVTEDRDRLRQDLNDAPDVTWIARCDEAEAEVDRLSGERGNLEVQVRAYIRLLDAIGDACPGGTDPIAAVNRLRDEANAHEGELGDMRAQLSAAEVEVVRLRGELETAQGQLAEMRNVAHVTATAYGEVEKERDQDRAEVDRLRREREHIVQNAQADALQWAADEDLGRGDMRIYADQVRSGQRRIDPVGRERAASDG